MTVSIPRRVPVQLLLALLGCAPLSCGYSPVLRDRESTERFCVVASSPAVADAAAVAAFEAAVRQRLSRYGALEKECSPSRRVTISLLTLASMPEGIVASDARPLARGERVVAMASAVVDDNSQPLVVQGEVVVGANPSTWSEAQVQSDARGLAASRAGDLLARRLLGEPGIGP